MPPESEYCPLEKGAYDLHFVSEKIWFAEVSWLERIKRHSGGIRRRDKKKSSFAEIAEACEGMVLMTLWYICKA